jgi:hypothetical protein
MSSSSPHTPIFQSVKGVAGNGGPDTHQNGKSVSHGSQKLTLFKTSAKPRGWRILPQISPWHVAKSTIFTPSPGIKNEINDHNIPQNGLGARKSQIGLKSNV